MVVSSRSSGAGGPLLIRLRSQAPTLPGRGQLHRDPSSAMDGRGVGTVSVTPAGLGGGHVILVSHACSRRIFTPAMVGTAINIPHTPRSVPPASRPSITVTG